MLALLFLAFQSPITPVLTPDSYGTHTITINGAQETFTISGPNPKPQTPTPLLILFHGSAGRYTEHPCSWHDYDVVGRATGAYKDWFVVQHDGAFEGCGVGYASYGTDKSQLHTRRVINRVKRYFEVDENRIYGYGFSSGGMEALSFAARHQNPRGNMFAAVINHSGYIMPTYAQVPPTQSYPCLYGSSYCTDPFPWQKAGLLDLDRDAACMTTAWPPLVSTVDPFSSQIQNIGWMPIQTYYAVNEHPNTDMRAMNQLLRDVVSSWFTAPPTFIHEFDCTTWVGGCSSTPPNCCNPPGQCGSGCPNGAKHAWDAVCADAALDFFDGKTRDGYLDQVYSNQNMTLAAEDKRYHALRPTRVSSGDFGRYEWLLEEVANRMSLYGIAGVSANIAELTLVLDEFTPLDPVNAIRPLTLDNGSGLAVPLTITGYDNGPPQHLLKDGAVRNDGQGWDWVAPDTIEITDTQLAEWVVIP